MSVTAQSMKIPPGRGADLRLAVIAGATDPCSIF